MLHEIAENVRRDLSSIFDIMGDLLVVVLPIFLIALCILCLIFLWK